MGDIKADWPSTGADDPLHKRKFHKTLTRVRAMCQALPETDEKISRGHTPIVTVRKKNFAIFWRADGRPNVCLNVPTGVQGILVDADRERYFVPAYMGVRGWVGVRLDNDIDWPTLEGLIADGHSFSAPKPKVRTRR